MRLSLAGALLGLLAVAVPAAAQDANYWSIQYGPVAQLLGGQVVGSSRDLSATYYNPGGLALTDTTPFLLSVQAFQLESVSLQPEGAGVLQASSTVLAPAPSLTAGSFPKGWLGENSRLAWSFLVREQLNVRLTQRYSAVDPASGVRVAAEALFDQDMSENWGGLTFSRRLGERFGLGATIYGAWRGQRTRREVNIESADSRAPFTALNVTDFDYGHARGLMKAGLAWEGDTLRLGLAVTTPSVSVFGGGNVVETRSVNGLDADGDGKPDVKLDATAQSDLDAYYRSSWAFAGGASFRHGRTEVSVTGEYFVPVDRFTVIDLGADAAASTRQFTQQLSGVFNGGIGIEHKLYSGTAVYAAFATDFSAAVGDPNVNVAASTWNLYHLTTGTAFTIAGSRFTLGVSGAFGSDLRRFPPDTPVVGDRPVSDLKYRRLTFVLGFVFGQ